MLRKGKGKGIFSLKNTGARLLTMGLILLVTACGNNNSKKQTEALKKGPELFTKYGCNICHSLDGTMIYGPPLNEIYLKKVKVIRNGQETTITADRDYLKKAITDPRFEKVAEYSNKEMPIPSFSDEETEILVDYIISQNNKAD